MKNLPIAGLVVFSLLLCGLGCGQFPQSRKVNLFEVDNAAKAAEKIREKIGAEKVNVISAEVRKNELKVTIQSPNDPKNIDEYTFKNDIVSGPKPVEAFHLGSLDMTADKYHLTELSEINFAAIPETVQRAVALSKLEGSTGRIDIDGTGKCRAGRPETQGGSGARKEGSAKTDKG